MADGSLIFDTKINSEGLSSGLKAGMVALTALGVAGAAAAYKVTRSALDSSAALEQNIGGVETLFGAQGKSLRGYAQMTGQTVEEAQGKYKTLMQSQKMVMDNAKIAYKTAGVSANTYMQQITSFSASLLQSLGGDTVKAAKIGNMAMVDMSDNANKFGTNIGDIQHAYQGFAKQNFTMLDNLKLGYGGTKEEMQRLIDKANELNAQHGKHTKYTIDSFSDIVQAIHTVQDEMHITGTTAEEAMSTVSGSIGSAKAAWDNFLNGEISADELVHSVVIAFKNVKKALDKIIPRLLEGIPKAFKALGKELNMPILTEIGNIIQFLIKNFEAFKAVVLGLTIAFGGLKIAMAAINLASTILNNPTALLNPVTAITLAIGLLIAAIIYLWNNCKPFRDFFINMWKSIATVVKTVWNGIKAFFTAIIPGIITFIKAYFTVWLTFHKMVFKAIFTVVKAVWNGIKAFFTVIIPGIITFIKAYFTALLNFHKMVFKGIFTVIKTVWNGIKTFFTRIVPNIVNTIIKFFSKLPGKISGFFTKIVSNIMRWGQNAFNVAKNGAKKIWDGIVNTVSKLPSKMMSLGADIVKGLGNGITAAWGWVKSKVSGLVGGLVDGVKGLLGIHSPSTVFKYIGKMCVDGFEESFDEFNPYETLDKTISAKKGVISANFLSNLPSAASVENTKEVNQTFNIYQPVKTPSEVARAIRLEQQYGLAGV